MANVIWRIIDLIQKGRQIVVDKLTPVPEATYIISEDGRSILCLRCSKRSHNPKDVERKFCRQCGYHEIQEA